ncbi:hypothetical protein [Pseudoneobacillus rhizosphaerae]|uniref:Uncharacterized protein n=1 Tax=Pseudoneobacillus rhizosphaerae TaxID=2880968 RepID=A0A9C7L9Y9_9BACI|nr:hypothetical protein [Pseudoneobacillus rhizosphaerae]CAG9606870.1 hypothetical protein NEOCIP111885_00558 [Pseudoneobacillus rhizosphaerae]
MKKKSSVFILVLIVFLVVSNTGYAKSVSKKITAVFGSHVVKLNGKTQTTETLAYGSKVYVQMDELTKLSGATVKKTGNTYAITPVVKEDGITKKTVNNLKIQVQLMDTYKNLEDLTDYHIHLADSLHYSAYAISIGEEPTSLLTAEALQSSLVEKLESISKDFGKMKASAKSQGINIKKDIAIVEGMISETRHSLNQFKQCIDLIKKYAATSQESFSDESFELQKEASITLNTVGGEALDWYTYYVKVVTGK